MQVTSIQFENQAATAVLLENADKPADALPMLGLDLPAMIVLVLGSTAPISGQQAADLMLFFESLYDSTGKLGAMLVFGGTESGIFRPLGLARTNYSDVPLLGVAPAGKVSYPGKDPTPASPLTALNPNASHFVLPAVNEFGQERSCMFAIARSASDGCPVVAILIGGGTGSKAELQECVLRRYPVFVVEDVEGLGNQLAEALKVPAGTGAVPEDLVELLCHRDDFEVSTLKESPAKITSWLKQRAVTAQHVTDSEVLNVHWKTYLQYDLTSIREQNRFYALEVSILTLGVLVTIVSVLSNDPMFGSKPGGGAGTSLSSFQQAFHIVTIALPLVVALLTAYLVRFKPGSKWTLLRGAAEAIKREIFKYRAGAGDYRRKPGNKGTPEHALATSIGAITQSAQQAEVNAVSLIDADDKILNEQVAKGYIGNSALTGDEYTKCRVLDQVNYYEGKTRKLDRQLRWIQFVILLSGGVGSALAALGAAPWIAVATAVATALAAYVSIKQVEPTLVKYNQVKTDLLALANGFNSLSAKRQYSPAALDAYVSAVEQTLERELRGWVQQMQEALKDTTKTETEQGPKDPIPHRDPSQPGNVGGPVQPTDHSSGEP